MRFELSDDQAMLRESIRGTLAREAGRAQIRAWAESGDWSAFDELAARQCWEDIGTAEDDGGQGGGLDHPAGFAADRGAITGRAELVLDAPGRLRLVVPVHDGETIALWAVDT